MSRTNRPPPMKRVTLTVDPEDHRLFERLARNSNVSTSWLLRRSMREFLERHKHDDHLSIPIGQDEAS